MKKCNTCYENKDYTKFSKDNCSQDGYKRRCKSCDRDYRQANKEKIKEQNRLYNIKNRKAISKRSSTYYQSHKEEKKEYCKKYEEDNKEKLKEYRAEYQKQAHRKILRKKYTLEHKDEKREYDKQCREENIEQNKQRHFEYFQKNKDKIAKRQRDRRNSDPIFKFRKNISGLVYQSLKGNKEGRSINTLLQYTIKELSLHLESQFTEGMSWDNYGSEWHLDHIRPIESFNITSIEDEDFQKCWALPNLQPLWADLNLKKSNEWDGTEMNESIKLLYQNDDRYHLIDKELNIIIDDILESILHT